VDFGGTFMKLFREGGPVMYPLLIFSILGLVFIIERAIALRRAKINVNEFLAKIRKSLIVNRSIKDAIKVCEEYRGPVPSIMKAGLLKYGEPKEDVEKTIYELAGHTTATKKMGYDLALTIIAKGAGGTGTVSIIADFVQGS